MNNLKTKLGDLYDGKLETVFVDLSSVVSNEVVENTKFKPLKTKINSLEKKFSDATNFIHINQ